MVLSKEDAELFYKLFFSLLDYANRKYNICPDIGKMRTASSLNLVDVKEVANAVWDDPAIIEEYLRSRKNRISEDDAAILSSGSGELPMILFLNGILNRVLFSFHHQQARYILSAELFRAGKKFSITEIRR